MSERERIAAEAAKIKQTLRTPWGHDDHLYFSMNGGMSSGRIHITYASAVYREAMSALKLLDEALELIAIKP